MLWFDKLIERLYFNQVGNYALYDSLTNLFNYNWLELVGYKKYENKNVYITVIDINNFKQINDTYGHMYGNDMLKKISKQLVSISSIADPKSDIVRFGGDEFVIFSSTNIESIILQSKTDLSNIFSYGVYKKSPKEDVADSISKADHLMYRFKQARKQKINR